VLGISALLGACLLAFSLFDREARAQAPAALNYRLVFLVFLVSGAYVCALPYVGYRIATLLFVAVLQVTLKWPASRKGWIMVAVTAFATTAATYVIFESYLTVLLPRGRWTDF
jgi:hypothetical protein